MEILLEGKITMETIDINDLKANPKNPRRISKEDYAALKKAITKFGPLDGIVFNQNTGQLVGGHQRVQAFKELGGQPVIIERYEQPTSTGTVAIGYVLLNVEKFGYRVVHWEQPWENAANIVANRAQGEFDLDILAEVNFALQQLDNGAELLALSGQTDKEIEKLNKMIGVVEDEPPADDPSQEPESDKLTFALTREQREIVEEAIGHIKATKDLPTDQAASQNGSALYYMARDYLDRLHGLIDETPPTAN